MYSGLCLVSRKLWQESRRNSEEQNEDKSYGKVPSIIYKRTIRHNTLRQQYHKYRKGKRFSAYQRHQLSLRFGWTHEWFGVSLCRKLHWRCQLQRVTHRYPHTHTYGQRDGTVMRWRWQHRAGSGGVSEGEHSGFTSECPQTAPSGCLAGTS